MSEHVAPLTFHCSTIAAARNDAAKQIGIARAKLALGKVAGVDEALRLAAAFLESMTPLLDRLEEQHAKTIRVLARQLARVDAILEDIPDETATAD